MTQSDVDGSEADVNDNGDVDIVFCISLRLILR